MTNPSYSDNVFINCPFDSSYQKLFDAIVFAVFDCGYVARSALEIDDASQIRVEKILNIINDSKFGIHDISYTRLDPKTKLPRFNMPLELGFFISAKRFGVKEHKQKNCLIVDIKEHRYHKYISDIAGQDIRAHNNKPEELIKIIRNWLSTSSRRKTIPGGRAICNHYNKFRSVLPKLCKEAKYDQDDLTFNDYCFLISDWISVTN